MSPSQSRSLERMALVWLSNAATDQMVADTTMTDAVLLERSKR